MIQTYKFYDLSAGQDPGRSPAAAASPGCRSGALAAVLVAAAGSERRPVSRRSLAAAALPGCGSGVLAAAAGSERRPGSRRSPAAAASPGCGSGVLVVIH